MQAGEFNLNINFRGHLGMKQFKQFAKGELIGD